MNVINYHQTKAGRITDILNNYRLAVSINLGEILKIQIQMNNSLRWVTLIVKEVSSDRPNMDDTTYQKFLNSKKIRLRS